MEDAKDQQVSHSLTSNPSYSSLSDAIHSQSMQATHQQYSPCSRPEHQYHSSDAHDIEVSPEYSTTVNYHNYYQNSLKKAESYNNSSSSNLSSTTYRKLNNNHYKHEDCIIKGSRDEYEINPLFKIEPFAPKLTAQKPSLRDFCFISKDCTKRLADYIVNESWGGYDYGLLYKYLDYIFRCQLFRNQVIQIDNQYLMYVLYT